MAKLFATLAIVGVVFAAVVEGTADKDIEDCKAQTGATDEDVELNKLNAPPSSKQQMCLEVCIMQKNGRLDGSGKMIVAAAVADIQKLITGVENAAQIAEDSVNACSGIEVSAEQCDAATLYNQCISDELQARNAA